MTPSALGGRNKRWRFGSRGAPGGDEARGGKQGEEQCGANEVPHIDPLRIGLRCCTTISAANRQGMVNAGYPNWVNRWRRLAHAHVPPAIHAVSGETASAAAGSATP